MRGPVLVVGSRGNVGAATVRALVERSVPVRAGVAGPAPASATAATPGVESVHLDLFRPETFGPAVQGIGGLLLLRPPPVSRVGPTLNALIEAAVAAGVPHIVFSSVAGADTNRLVPHHRVETHLRQHAPSWTILRPGFFAQNLADAYRRDITEDDRIHLPAGEGSVAFVDTDDIGAVAAGILAEPGPHRGRGYTLTGPQAVTFGDLAGMLTAALGRHIGYEPATVLGYARHLRSRGLPIAQVAVQTVLHVGLRRGDAEHVDPTLSHLLGRPARSIEEYVRDHAATWARPAQ
ncbi:NAD(P)H-binding protein [Humibacillus xanthopallidus]|uniref:NmrA family NAD(P)-binding protein n=1 Tax=Humibacillus xanthopallidus TaxID=412689 RepID=UPI00385106F9